MNRKLKFVNLMSPRYTRNMTKKIANEASSSVSSTSQYFPDDTNEAKRSRNAAKKGSPLKAEINVVPKIKIKTEKSPATDGPKPRKIAATKRSPGVAEYEEMPKIEIKTEKSPESDQPKPRKITVKKRSPVKIEYEEVPETDTKTERFSRIDGSKSTNSSEQWQPKNWQLMLANIQEMRKYETAPVDQMGCHKCSDPNADASVSRFQALVALMLSSQTKDQVTFAAMQRLKSHGCTPENLIRTSDETLGHLIYPVGFWKRKVGYIKKTAEILLEQYAGDIPKTIDGLCKLPGVGPKMGHICMQVAWGEVSGIGVDTHVHRISNRLGWVQKETKTPEQTRLQLESWLPREKWTEINHILVGFGQEICLPVGPKCTGCLNKDICPYRRKNPGK